MSKEPVFHIDECMTCLFRNDCEHVKAIDDLVQNGLPLDLRGVSCEEYEPEEDILDNSWTNYTVEGGEPETNVIHVKDTTEMDEFSAELLTSLNMALAQAIMNDMDVTCIHMNQETMEMLKNGFGAKRNVAKIVLTDGSDVVIKVSDTIETGYFMLELEYYDDEDEI